jgi:hypothetical protein
MNDGGIYKSGRELAAAYHAKVHNLEAVLDGREPPALVEVRHYGSFAEMMGFPLGTDPRLVWHVLGLKGEFGKFGTELLEQREEHYRAERTTRRRLQLTRHNAARTRGQPSPLEVLHVVDANEERLAGERGAAAATAVHFGKHRSRISKLLFVAEDCWQQLEALRAYFQSRIDFGCGDELEALPTIVAKIRQVLRKLPPRRRPWTVDAGRECCRQNRTFSKPKRRT